MTRITRTLLLLGTLLLMCSLVTSINQNDPVPKRIKARNRFPIPRRFPKASHAEVSISIIEILNEAILSLGKSLWKDKDKRKRVLANQKSLLPFLLGMAENINYEQTRERNWEKAEASASVFLELANGNSYGGDMAHRLNGWGQRRDGWMRLVDKRRREDKDIPAPERDRPVLLLPSIDVERVCADPLNRPTILGRYFGTVGYTMVLIASNRVDMGRAPEPPGSPASRVMGATDYLLQWRCLWTALHGAKMAFAGDGPWVPGNLIDLAVRTLEMALHHMDKERDGHELEHGDEYESENENENEVNYMPKGKVRALKKDAEWLKTGAGEKHAFLPQLEKLRDSMGDGKHALWQSCNYKVILDVARRIGQALQKILLEGKEGLLDKAMREGLLRNGQKKAAKRISLHKELVWMNESG